MQILYKAFSESISGTYAKSDDIEKSFDRGARLRMYKHLCTTTKVNVRIKIHASQRSDCKCCTLRRPAVKVECVGGNGRASYLKDREAKRRLKGDGDQNEDRRQTRLASCPHLYRFVHARQHASAIVMNKPAVGWSPPEVPRANRTKRRPVA